MSGHWHVLCEEAWFMHIYAKALTMAGKWGCYMTSMEPWPEDTSPAITVLVIDKDEVIRTTLGDFLEDAGYAVIEADNFQEAESLIDAAPEPMVLIVGDAEVGVSTELEFFTAVAANPVTNHAYIYLTTTPERWRLPALVQVLTD